MSMMISNTINLQRRHSKISEESRQQLLDSDRKKTGISIHDRLAALSKLLPEAERLESQILEVTDSQGRNSSEFLNSPRNDYDQMTKKQLDQEHKVPFKFSRAHHGSNFLT